MVHFACLPAVSVPDVEDDEADGRHDAQAGDAPHAHEERQREGPQHAPHDGAVLGHLAAWARARANAA